jgi:hypothetical protein
MQNPLRQGLEAEQKQQQLADAVKRQLNSTYNFSPFPPYQRCNLHCTLREGPFLRRTLELCAKILVESHHLSPDLLYVTNPEALAEVCQSFVEEQQENECRAYWRAQQAHTVMDKQALALARRLANHVAEVAHDAHRWTRYANVVPHGMPFPAREEPKGCSNEQGDSMEAWEQRTGARPTSFQWQVWKKYAT